MKEPLLETNELPLLAPHGLDEITASFGDIHEYVGADGQLEERWQVDFLDESVCRSRSACRGTHREPSPT